MLGVLCDGIVAALVGIGENISDSFALVSRVVRSVPKTMVWRNFGDEVIKFKSSFTNSLREMKAAVNVFRVGA